MNIIENKKQINYTIEIEKNICRKLIKQTGLAFQKEKQEGLFIIKHFNPTIKQVGFEYGPWIVHTHKSKMIFDTCCNEEEVGWFY